MTNLAPTTTSHAKARNTGLDLLRLAAVTLVFFNHATYETHLFPSPFAGILEAMRRGGWVGVDLFFVLSGFLVSGLIFDAHKRTGHASIGNFLLRRCFKIYPAFWVLLAYTTFSLLRRDVAFPVTEFLGEIFFLQNYLGQLWGHTWSLAVEEHFYLGVAVIFTVLQRRPATSPFDSIPLLFGCIALLCLILRIIEAQLHPVYSWEAHLSPSHLRVDSLFFGVLLAYGIRYRNLSEKLRQYPIFIRVILGTALFLPAFFLERAEHRWLTVFGYNLLYLGAGLLVLSTLELDFSRNPLFRTLASLGAASYSIYLWHAPVNIWAARLTKHQDMQHDFLYLSAYFAGAILFGFIMFRLVEVPILRVRARITHS